ncbi:MAG: histidinol dehydrogenase, partial [Ruminococcus sp.]|nr:histidinol dehydrogenase [Ruminococcus sp.]
MITTVKADGVQEYAFIDTLKKRAQNSDKNVIPVVSEILENVRENGDKAVREYTVKFDGKAPEHTEITAEEIDNIVKLCDPELLETFRKASDNIADFHRRQVQQSWLTTKTNGVIMGQRVRGLKRVGIYVPGGTAVLPSSVLMNAIPAKLAGVEELIMVTPPQKDGTPNPNIVA